MNSLSIFTLKALRRIYIKMFGDIQYPQLPRIQDVDKANEIIYDKLKRDNPCMIARYGAFELSTVINYLGVSNTHHSTFKFIKGQQPEWWWNESIMKHMCENAGFYPPLPINLARFSKLMLKESKQVDILGSWLSNEYFLKDYMASSLIRVDLEKINPFFANVPWTGVLKNKKILVVHPFAQSILKQYDRRKLLFKNKDILPDFKSLEVIKAVQSMGGMSSFKDWFEAFDYMKSEINKRDYDICLLGCGSYGFPLAAYIKRCGKKAVHLGGVLQLYFGIKGKRWESEGYVGTDHDYSKFFNKYWIRPSEDETPQQSSMVENGCYW